MIYLKQKSMGNSILRLLQGVNRSIFREIPTEYNKCKPRTLSTLPQNYDENNKRLAYVHSCLDSGLVAYARGWAWQQALLNRRLEYQRQISSGGIIISNEKYVHEAAHDQLVLLEHHPVYTLGRGADEENLTFLDREPDGGARARQKLSRKSRGAGSARLSVDKVRKICLDHPLIHHVNNISDDCSLVQAPNGASIYRVDRGGEVTFHGPGQLVAYPLLDLRKPPLKQDLHWYLRCIEDVIIDTLRAYDIRGVRDEINTGVWVGKEKIAAVGVSSSRWITTHGLALNVDPDLSFFDTSVVIPCGIKGRGVTSIAKLLRERGENVLCIPTMKEVAIKVVQNFEHAFGVTTVKGKTII